MGGKKKEGREDFNLVSSHHGVVSEPLMQPCCQFPKQRK
jgi:hypothetical protein